MMNNKFKNISKQGLCILTAAMVGIMPVATSTITQPLVVEAASRAETVTVNNVKVTISSSVSDTNYNKVVSWVKALPFHLRKNLDTVTICRQLPWDNANAIGAQYKNGVWILESELKDGKAILYHEAAHVLDYSTNWNLSGSTTWKSFYKTEWGNAGYNSSVKDSFAQAVSNYYCNSKELDARPKSKAFVKEVLTGGYIKNGWQNSTHMVYAKTKNVRVYYSPDANRAKCAGTIKIGGSVKATGYNNAKQWYRVWYNNTSCYVKISDVSLTP